LTASAYGEELNKVAARDTKARAKTNVEMYRPDNCDFPKKLARKWDETIMDVIANRLRKRKRMSDVFVKSSCVKRIDDTSIPGK
jgi:hypothetical protein